jgi:hypothetical protein
MDIEILTRHFARIGARLDVRVQADDNRRRSNRRSEFTLDINESGNNERFELTVDAALLDGLEMHAIEVRRDLRHLLLLALRPDGTKEKFLCGHDERHWFVAAVPEGRGVADVNKAIESLKPDAARMSQRANHVRQKNLNRRRNAGFIRQGEWFFLPHPDFTLDDARLILRKEPIRRGASKPHIVEEIYRNAGVQVYVSSRFPYGLLEREYKRRLEKDPNLVKLTWQIMRRGARVMARGRVTHPDHKTIVLPYWHEVLMNTERSSGNVAFLD